MAEVVSAGAAVAQGVANKIGWDARQSAAAILTKGNAGNLPGPSGYATRADYAKALSGNGSLGSRVAFSNPATMVTKHPYSASAASTKTLATGAARAATYTPPKLLGPALLVVDPLAHGVSAGVNASGDGYDRFFAGVTGAAKRLDNVGIAGVGGSAAGSVVGLASGPAAPAVGPAVGVAAGIAIGTAYQDSRIDNLWNSAMTSTLGKAEPYLASGARQVGQGIGQLTGLASSALGLGK